MDVDHHEAATPLTAASADFRLPEPTAWDLAGNIVHVWRACLDQEPEALERYAATLSKDERRRAQLYYGDRDRRDFVASRGLLRTLLGHYLGIAPGRLRFSYGERGKPALAAGFDARLRFNLSHSGRLLLCAIAWDSELGVDVEAVRDLPDLDDVAKSVFSPGELAVLRGLAAPEKRQAFFRCWTRKEAYIKADGNGFALPVGEIEVTVAAGEPARLLRGPGFTSESCRWSMQDLAPATGYAGAIAVESTGWQLRCWNWESDMTRPPEVV